MGARHFLQRQLGTMAVVREAPTADWSLGFERAKSEQGTPTATSIQERRLADVITRSQAQGGALFVVDSKETRLVLHNGLSSSTLHQLERSVGIADGEPGLWFTRTSRGRTFHFYLKSQDCPQFLEKLIHKYMAVWSELYH